MNLHKWLDQEKGRARDLSKFLGVSKTAVSLWRDNGVPLPYMPRVVEFTDGAVTIAEMAEHAVACRTREAA